jgi:hypothetical protein
MTMSGFVSAVLVTVATVLLERLAVQLVGLLWDGMRPATA